MNTEAETLECSLMPGGQIDVRRVETDRETRAVQPDAIERITDAFSEGRGRGLLHLGVAELLTDLPPELSFWRETGRIFISRVCGFIDPYESSLFTIPEPDSQELSSLLDSVPPMPGAEEISESLLRDIWADMGQALLDVSGKKSDGVQRFLKENGSVWNVLGRVCFHMAENKKNPSYPFAFMATYINRVSKKAKPQHIPLGRALKDYAGQKNREKLLSLLAPLSRASEKSDFIRLMVDSGDIYHPVSWSPVDAHRFLCETPLYEECGLLVRIPNWWKQRRRPRPRVSVSIGNKSPSLLGMDSVLDFDVKLTLGGKKLTRKEIKEILASGEGLVLLKGEWVEVDKEKISGVLGFWQDVQKRAEKEGISFGEAMRMLSGAVMMNGEDSVDDDRPEWSEVIAGKWLESRLESLSSPELDSFIEKNAGLNAELRPYQKYGVQWLNLLSCYELGGCLADDMGLGKTIQVLGLLSLMKKTGRKGTDLLVVPASLIDNWKFETERFAPHIKMLIAHPSKMPSADLKKIPQSMVKTNDVVITTYGTVLRTEWMKKFKWRNIILDEAQAIKNPDARQTKAVKSIESSWKLALTGTPVENKLNDLWSIFDFLNPGLLGSATMFRDLCKVMDHRSNGYAPLRKLVSPYIMRRLKTDKKIIADLPDKTELNAFCLLSKRQASLYKQSVDEMKKGIDGIDGIKRRGIVLSFLMRLKQICNHPSQWLGDGEFLPSESGKFSRLAELCESVAARQDKALIFTQFRQMTEPLAEFLEKIFGKEGLVLHGGTPVSRRQKLVTEFQNDPRKPFMILSLKAGGSGLNLTAASHVIHFDRWWNPAVENQATDRAFRIGQRKNVLVHKFVCRGTIEERINELIDSKRQLSDDVLSVSAEKVLTEMSNDELISMVSLDLNSAVEG